MTSAQDKANPPPPTLETLISRPFYTVLLARSFLIRRDHSSSRVAARPLGTAISADPS
jgi:hypothetical protein